jgi:peptidoglycan/xylan/chitin deacetylase (PgdA/CDA1 family)
LNQFCRICLPVLLLALSVAGCATAPDQEAPAVDASTASPQDAATPWGRNVAPNQLTSEQAMARLQAERDRFWLNAREEVYKNVIELLAQDQVELQRGLRFSKLIRGSPRRKQIALTFDDGPHPAYTPKLLAILKRYNVKATFFLVGEMAERSPDLVRAEAAAGHSLGNHTYHHVSLPKIPDEDVATEIKSCGQVLRSITGRAPRWFRPPGGEYDPHVAQVSEALGYTMVLWTDDPGDYASPGRQVILSRTLRKIGNGGILLLHDGIQQTVDVLPQIIETLQRQGYEFVTVDEMIAAKRKPEMRSPAGDRKQLEAET